MRYSILPLPIMILLALGCSSTSSTPAPGPETASAEDQVKTAFVTLQQAIKDRDADKLWDLIDKHIQGDADRAAANLKDKFGKADPEEVKKLMGITPEELNKLTGKAYLKTKAFYDDKEIKELVSATNLEPKIDSKDMATVYYPDEEKPGDKDHVKFIKVAGKWKARLRMPHS